MKKVFVVLTVLLLLTLCFGLVACDKKGTTEPATQSDPTPAGDSGQTVVPPSPGDPAVNPGQTGTYTLNDLSRISPDGNYTYVLNYVYEGDECERTIKYTQTGAYDLSGYTVDGEKQETENYYKYIGDNYYVFRKNQDGEWEYHMDIPDKEFFVWEDEFLVLTNYSGEGNVYRYIGEPVPIAISRSEEDGSEVVEHSITVDTIELHSDKIVMDMIEVYHGEEIRLNYVFTDIGTTVIDYPEELPSIPVDTEEIAAKKQAMRAVVEEYLSRWERSSERERLMDEIWGLDLPIETEDGTIHLTGMTHTYREETGTLLFVLEWEDPTYDLYFEKVFSIVDPENDPDPQDPWDPEDPSDGWTYTRIDEAGEEAADGDYILFGSYPQSEVTDEEIVSALNAAAGELPTAEDSKAWTSYQYYIEGSNDVDYMWYIDLEQGGEKYRGAYFTSYRPDLTFDSSSADNSYQDDNGYGTYTIYWFKYEPLKWRILEEEDGEALILCESIIDGQEYYYSTSVRTIEGETVYANNYAESDIRAWLNDTFYHAAFTDLQKQLIALTTVDNSARSTNPNNNATEFNNGTNTSACADTEDYVFLLSVQEVTNIAYGFDGDRNAHDPARQKKNTDYAKSQGVWISTNSGFEGNGSWWLRSPYYDYSSLAWFVFYDATIYIEVVYNGAIGVVPALRIRLTETPGGLDPITPQDPGEDPQDPGEDPEEPIDGWRYTRIDVVGEEDESGEYILFGTYPQSEVTDEEIKAALNVAAGTLPTAENSQAWTSYEYYIKKSNETDFMWYIDLELGGDKYRGVYFTSYRPYYTTSSSSTDNSYQDDNGYEMGNVYWFKYEPIRWRILSQEGGEALILCEMIIDSQEYYHSTNTRTIDGDTVYANNYACSNIRAWLNSVFYETAFSDLQRDLILRTTVDNSVASTGSVSGSNPYACEDTEDYVFLLSTQEVTNSGKKTTDYAQVQGAYAHSGGSYDGNGMWWLRSPISNYDNITWCLVHDGYFSNYYVYNTSRGVVPALRISLS